PARGRRPGRVCPSGPAVRRHRLRPAHLRRPRLDPAPGRGAEIGRALRPGGDPALRPRSRPPHRPHARGGRERPVTDAVCIVPPGTLAVGMQLPVAAQSTVFAAPWEAAAGPEELLRVAQACDRAAFLYVAVCDHVCIPRERAAAMSTVWYDPVATLGWLAAATRSVRLLSYVYVAAYRHPLQTAKAFATLDALSGGRVILGVGAGHLEREFAALG